MGTSTRRFAESSAACDVRSDAACDAASPDSGPLGSGKPPRAQARRREASMRGAAPPPKEKTGCVSDVGGLVSRPVTSLQMGGGDATCLLSGAAGGNLVVFKEGRDCVLQVAPNVLQGSTFEVNNTSGRACMPGDL